MRKMCAVLAILSLPLSCSLLAATPALAESGADIWQKSCAECHKNAGKFKGAEPAALEKKLIDFTKKETTNPKSVKMQNNIKALTPEQLKTLTKFMSRGGAPMSGGGC